MFVSSARYTCSLLLLLPYSGFACEDSIQCIEPEQWSIGLAIGAGAKSNPLVDGDAIPQVLLFDIAWYGENTYFDNGELGVRWLQEKNFGIESYLTLDRERAFFYFWDPANIFINTGVVYSDSGQETPPLESDSGEGIDVSINDISARKWTVLAGSRFNYYQGSQKWTLSFETDATGVHNGQRIGLYYQKAWGNDNWRVLIKPSLTWKSDALIDYYYGLDEADVVAGFYAGKGGFQPSISLFYAYNITPKWQFIFSSSYQSLHTGMTKSPLVKDKHVSSLFIGAGYRF
jgi:outer membrane protein